MYLPRVSLIGYYLFHIKFWFYFINWFSLSLNRSTIKSLRFQNTTKGNSPPKLVANNFKRVQPRIMICGSVIACRLEVRWSWHCQVAKKYCDIRDVYMYNYLKVFLKTKQSGKNIKYQTHLICCCHMAAAILSFCYNDDFYFVPFHPLSVCSTIYFVSSSIRALRVTHLHTYLRALSFNYLKIFLHYKHLL